MTPFVLGCRPPNRVLVHSAFNNKGITRHRAGDGKERVARQSESNKNDREAKPEHKKSRGLITPIDTVAPADPPGPFVSTARLSQTAGLLVEVALLQCQSPSFCQVGSFVLCSAARQRFLGQLAKKVSHRDVAFLDPRRAAR